MAVRKPTKLTLVVDPSVVRRAKSYASSHATSVSALIEAYLRQLTESDRRDITDDPRSWPPLTRRLYASLKTEERQDIDYEKLKLQHLTEKYLHD